MRRARPAALFHATLAAALACCCGPKQVRPAQPTGRDQVVLLPDAELGTTGHASVSSGSGTVELTEARQSTTISTGQAPTPVVLMSEADVRRLFGAALAALPPAPTRFTLFYKFDSDELTDESSALVPKILQAVKERPFPDVIVIGHTDTIGTPTSNYALGMRRAVAVRSLLIEAGLDSSFVEVTSHGESDLFVATADNVAEPRNRRVEITVR